VNLDMTLCPIGPCPDPRTMYRIKVEFPWETRHWSIWDRYFTPFKRKKFFRFFTVSYDSLNVGE
jgi:hypothetical protein